MTSNTTQHIHQKVINILNRYICPINSTEAQYDDLLNLIGNSRFVLMGEATHGTEEFYQARIAITQQLILRKGFMAIAIEGDWPDAYHIHSYLQRYTNKNTVDEALASFKRFPTWMWRNTTIPPFLSWLREYNDLQNHASLKVGFYGLDLYSLHTSMQNVIAYLTDIDPHAAKQARFRYSCLGGDYINFNPQNYGHLVTSGLKRACTRQVIEQLLEIQQHAYEYLFKNGQEADEEYFSATQNARLVKNAEAYYRAMFEDYISSWNLRDQHMAETLEILANHLEEKYNKPAKIIVWAHNSHIGDARATEMHDRGELNLGQLMRERHESSAFLLGFSTYQGTVTAANEWDTPPFCKPVVPALPGSYEALFHEVNSQNFLLPLANQPEIKQMLLPARLKRAIGVIYRPDTERLSHYYFSHLPYQFDAILHFDETQAVTPIDKNMQLQEEIPDTFPYGI